MTTTSCWNVTDFASRQNGQSQQPSVTAHKYFPLGENNYILQSGLPQGDYVYEENIVNFSISSSISAILVPYSRQGYRGLNGSEIRIVGELGAARAIVPVQETITLCCLAAREWIMSTNKILLGCLSGLVFLGPHSRRGSWACIHERCADERQCSAMQTRVSMWPNRNILRAGGGSNQVALDESQGVYIQT